MNRRMIKIYRRIIGMPISLWKKRDFDHNISSLERVAIQITGRCNLNCKGCSVFSPLAADEKDMTFEQYCKDIDQFAKLFESDLKTILIMGGEPLLNTDINRMMRKTREVFPNVSIVLVTNGVKLLYMGKDFWECVRISKVEIGVTKYPINLPFSKIKKKAESEKVKLKFYGRSRYIKKTLYHLPLDCSGSQDSTKSFRGCFMARDCIEYRNGIIYPCSLVSSIHRFNSYFSKTIPVTRDDYCDIYTESREQILQKISHPINLCHYCDVNSRTYGNRWEQSGHDIAEWT